MIKVPGHNFYIGETPVTQKLWTAVMNYNPSHFHDRDMNPVDNISHRDCMTFIEKLSEITGVTFSLPSRKEWLLAAMGLDRDSFVYARSNDPEEVGWFGGGTHPVRLKKPNSIGLFDMTGNVWEWCSDIAPATLTIMGQPTELVKNSNGESFVPTYYYLKGGSFMNGYKSSRLVSDNRFGEYCRTIIWG